MRISTVKATLKMKPSTAHLECWDNLTLLVTEEDNITHFVSLKCRELAVKFFYDLSMADFDGYKEKAIFEVDGRTLSLSPAAQDVALGVLTDWLGDYFQYEEL